MKLLHKITRYYFRLSVVLFIVGSFFAYFILRALIVEEVDETLLSEKHRIIKDLQQKKDLIPEWHSINMEIEKVAPPVPKTETLEDTLLFIGDSREWVPLRQFKFIATINGIPYRITLRRSMIENDDLVTGVSLLMSGLFLATILIFNFLIYHGDRKLWGPFYQTLKELDRFDLHNVEALSLPEVDIAEFAQLNHALNELTKKIQNDYRSIREFSENASHEMQTPLAVMRSKLDNLVQSTNLSETQLKSMRSLYDAVNRLSRLNHSLNLLTRIENREYTKTERLNLSTVIESQLQNLNEIIQLKNLTVSKHMEPETLLEINDFMCETLVSNLLTNAINHNIPNGQIDIRLTRTLLGISNSGPKPDANPEQYFNRFKKGNPVTSSPGLGLAIVRKICRENNFRINYTYQDKQHCIQVFFKAS